MSTNALRKSENQAYNRKWSGKVEFVVSSQNFNSKSLANNSRFPFYVLDWLQWSIFHNGWNDCQPNCWTNDWWRRNQWDFWIGIRFVVRLEQTWQQPVITIFNFPRWNIKRIRFWQIQFQKIFSSPFSTPRSKRDTNNDASAEEDEEEEEEYPDYEDDENTEEYELSPPYERLNAFNLIRFSLHFSSRTDSRINQFRSSKLTSIHTGTITETIRYVQSL